MHDPGCWVPTPLSLCHGHVLSCSLGIAGRGGLLLSSLSFIFFPSIPSSLPFSLFFSSFYPSLFPPFPSPLTFPTLCQALPDGEGEGGNAEFESPGLCTEHIL